MEEIDVRGLEIFGQERTMYLIFKFREKSPILFLDPVEYDCWNAADLECSDEVGVLEMLLSSIEV